MQEFKIQKDLVNKLRKASYLFTKSKELYSQFTGLIFAGFGEDEIYPSLIPVNISLSIKNKLRYFIDEDLIAKITNEVSGAIRPFAQTDVINTILTGIDPSLENTYLKNFEKFLQKYNNHILNLIGNSNKTLMDQIENININKLVNEYEKYNHNIKKSNYISPLMNAVSNLSKEDLAEMAESLIYLTYLKRRITFAEESVGGPVDVALISKGDGFIWIKRKHYFKPELNQHFFKKYFN